MERTISVVTDVKDLSELLNGASVDAARLSPSGGRLRLELELTRACPELPPVRRGGFLSRPKVPWVKSRLILDGIADVSVRRLDQTPQPVPLLSCEAVVGGYTLAVTLYDGLQLSLTLDQLSGTFADVGPPLVSP